MQRRHLAAVAVLAVLAVTGLGLTACTPARTYSFRIATRGPIVADVEAFARHVQATLDDPRGWSLGGSIRFVRTDGPASFTVWLAAAATLPGFGSPCSSQWSCRQGANVIINQDRWLGATPTWPYGIDAYQHYVVNHEVGHWMGFGHSTCPGPWLRAPVMVQQSKGGAAMGLCAFNVWPTDAELGGASARHRVPQVPTGLPDPDRPFGVLDRAIMTKDPNGGPTTVDLAGWAIDGDTAGPLRVLVTADGHLAADLTAHDERPDLAAAFPAYGPGHGFSTTVAVEASTREVCAVAIGTGGGAWLRVLGCQLVK